MHEVLFLDNVSPKVGSALLDDMHCLRHRVFKVRMGWEVTCHNGRERDLYDELSPIYLLCRTEKNQVEGCWRLLPTTGLYLLKDVFRDLLCGHSVPTSPTIWEISRFAIQTEEKGYASLAGVHEITGRMFAALF